MKQIQKSQVVLFSLRLFFYLSVLILLAIHPAIAISFDRVGIIQWFVIVPLMSILAFIPIKGRGTSRTFGADEGQGFGVRYQSASNKDSLSYKTSCPLSPVPCPRKLIIAGGLLILFSLVASGFNTTALFPFLAGVISFVLTFLLFHYPRWGKLSLLEPFFLIWICLRLLAISRSGEEVAGSAAGLTQFILVWSAVVFLLHGVVVYFCLFPNSKRTAGKEAALFFIGAAAALVLVLVVLPPDFIRNSIVENINKDRVPQKMGEESDRGFPRGSRRENRRQRGENGKEPELRGMSEYDWQTNSNRGKGRKVGDGSQNMQYLVKIVASETEPVYMGDIFRGQLDPVQGFLANENEPLNELSKQRLFTTWHNTERNYDIEREQKEFFSLSTLQERYLPYFPVTADPTIINEDAGPLRYIHQVVSRVHTGNTLALVFDLSRDLNSREEQILSSYLEVPLNTEDLKMFNTWLDNALRQWQENRNGFFEDNPPINPVSGEVEPVNEHLEKIFAVLTGFSEYQYNLSFNENTAMNDIKIFLFDTKDGDCTEFSISLALLGRLAGIPSRVVTGYLVAEELQTDAHLRGIMNLQRQIPFLQQFDFDNLFLVTNMHAHSWTQFYIPDYGWLDFEATQFAIPPAGGSQSDISTFDVVIPIIEEKKVFTNLRKFPWRAVLHTAGWLAVAALFGAYALRYGREAVLFARTKAGGRAGARALYLLLLAKLAADGKPIKPASKTATEYSDLFFKFNHEPHEPHEKIKQDHFEKFALFYSEIRWKEFEDKDELNSKFDLLKDEYKNIINITKRRGMGWWIVRIISLRGLAYL